MFFSDSVLAFRNQLKVGVVRPSSGPMSPIGKELMRGIKIAQEKAQKLEQKRLIQSIKVIEMDDGGKSSTAVRATERLISRNRVHVLIGSISNTVNHSIAQVAARKHKLLILPIGTDSDVVAKGKNVFSLSLTEQQQGEVLGKFTKSFLKQDKVLLMRESNNPYSDLLAGSFTSTFSKDGGQIKVIDFDVNYNSIQEQLNSSMAMKDSVYFLPSFYMVSQKVLQQYQRLGGSGVFLGGDGWDTYRSKDVFTKLNLNGHYYYVPYSVKDPHPANQRFVQSFRKKYKKDPSLAAFAGYEAFNLVVFAYRQTKSNRTAPLVSFLRAAKKLPSLSGSMKMSSQRSPKKPAIVLKLGKKGTEYVTKIPI